MEIEKGKMFKKHPTDFYLGCTHCKRLIYFKQNSKSEAFLCPYCYTVNFNPTGK